MISLLEDKQKGKFGVFVKCELYLVLSIHFIHCETPTLRDHLMGTLQVEAHS